MKAVTLLFILFLILFPTYSQNVTNLTGTYVETLQINYNQQGSFVEVLQFPYFLLSNFIERITIPYFLTGQYVETIINYTVQNYTNITILNDTLPVGVSKLYFEFTTTQDQTQFSSKLICTLNNTEVDVKVYNPFQNPNTIIRDYCNITNPYEGTFTVNVSLYLLVTSTQEILIGSSEKNITFSHSPFNVTIIEPQDNTTINSQQFNISIYFETPITTQGLFSYELSVLMHYNNTSQLLNNLTVSPGTFGYYNLTVSVPEPGNYTIEALLEAYYIEPAPLYVARDLVNVTVEFQVTQPTPTPTPTPSPTPSPVITVPIETEEQVQVLNETLNVTESQPPIEIVQTEGIQAVVPSPLENRMVLLLIAIGVIVAAILLSRRQ